MPKRLYFAPLLVVFLLLNVLLFGRFLVKVQPVQAQGDPDVQVLLDGAPAAIGTYTFPFPSGSTGLVLDNGLIRFNFNRDDAAGGIVTGWDGSSADRPATTSITATSVIVNGTELAHNLNGVAPRDPDRQHSFYVDNGGGTGRLICTQVKVIRNTADLVEVAFIDVTSSTLQYEHHLIMRRGKRGLYGYIIMKAASAALLNEVRMNTRWDHCIFDHAYNWERGTGQQPSYAYLATQTRVSDETWRVNGINDPTLYCPENNAGHMTPNTVYSKYNWSLYHHENPMWGHYGNGFGVWFSPLGGVTDQTLSAFYGVGPNHHDLALHQDAIILNYFNPNHYGMPNYSIPPGYTRLYGPWYTFVTVGDPNDPEATIPDAAGIAQTEIAENRAGAAWVNDPLYPTPAQRTTVTGRVQIADGRPADGLWVLLSTQDVTDVYTIHEPAYFVKTDADGNFTLPGVAPPWAAGTTAPSAYTLYIFASKGSITDQLKQSGITFSGPTKDLGTITWAPTNHTTFLWQIGKADRKGGEFALATNPADFSNPRSYEKPTQVPGTLNYVVGSSWEPENWYYAQTNGGTWTITFNLNRTYTGIGNLTVSTSMQSGSAPTLAINGTAAVGAFSTNNDGSIGRQADRSAYPQLRSFSFPASVLQVGQNTITLTRGAGSTAGNGLGWDTFILEVDELQAPPPAQLAATLQSISGTKDASVWRIRVSNNGAGPANDARLDGLALSQTAGGPGTPVILGRDPNRFPVPLGNIPPGGFVDYDVTINFAGVPDGGTFDANIPVSANGGRAGATISAQNITLCLPSNAALATNLATVLASTNHTSGKYPASSANDGDRTGVNWGNNGGWNDGTRNAYPDSLEVDFNETKTINEIRVYTLQNNWKTAGEPTATSLATGEGLLDFIVQTWDGTQWVTVPGGNVTGNDKAMRAFTFADIATTKIRVVVNNARNNWSRIVEVEAWQPGGVSTGSCPQ